ncbi:MAG: hypothetical protein JW862_08850 [Anaerolineales bacterium]|nr:hypothetical protein [Anaerolineales bacterium]
MKKYIAYLLRLWCGDEPGIVTWRASLEDPHTRKVIQFAQLAELTAYLQTLTETEGQPQSQSEPQVSQPETDHRTPEGLF